MQPMSLIAPPRYPIGLKRVRPQPVLGLHRHDVSELVLVTGGAGRHMTQEGSWPINRGTVFVIPPGMPHGFCEGGAEIINVQYDAKRLELPLGHLSCLPGYRALLPLGMEHCEPFAGHRMLDTQVMAAIESQVDSLEDEITQQQAGWELAAGGLLLRLLVHLTRAFTGHDADDARLAMQQEGVEAWILKHLTESLNVSAIARRLGISVAQAERRWRAKHGLTLRAWIETRRLEHARVLLSRGDLDIATVAKRSGFKDPGYLARRFRLAFGTTPRKTRQSALGGS